MRSSNPFAAGGRGYLAVMRFFAGLLLATAFAGVAVAQQNAAFTGRVTDSAGRPVEGAMVFLYNSADVRRTGDFISAPTDNDGKYRIVVVPGRYWAVARLKKKEGFGPLMPGDRHSGDPREIEIVKGQEVDMSFVVVDLKEALTSRNKERDAPFRIGGRILDERGDPVIGAYAVAQKNVKVTGIPDYISAWADAEGRYMLMLPKGKYYFGSAVEFPPREDLLIYREITVEADRSDMDIVRKSGPK